MKNEIKKIITEQLGRDCLEEIADNSTLNDLDIDSLDFVEIIMGVEEKYNISLPDVKELKTIGEFIHYAQEVYQSKIRSDDVRSYENISHTD